MRDEFCVGTGTSFVHICTMIYINSFSEFSFQTTQRCMQINSAVNVF